MESHAWFQLWSQITTSASVFDLSGSFNRAPLQRSQHAGQKGLRVSEASLLKLKVRLPRQSRGLCLIWSPPAALPCFVPPNAACCLATQVSQMYAWREGMNNLGSWYLLNDLNVQTSCVINRCNIRRTPSRYADAPSEALPLTSARLSCQPVRN